MRAIRITEEVWKEIARRGKFGETEDDVLRRVFRIEHKPGESSAPTTDRHTGHRGRYATVRMHSGVKNGQLVVSFESGAERRWDLPDRSQKERIRKIRSEALDFARQSGATQGQGYAVLKALTEAGYHITK